MFEILFKSSIYKNVLLFNSSWFPTKIRNFDSFTLQGNQVNAGMCEDPLLLKRSSTFADHIMKVLASSDCPYRGLKVACF